MKITIKRPVEIEVTSVLVTLPVNYDEEDIPNDFPLRNGNQWIAEIYIDTGVIRQWPKGRPGKLEMKVVDGGIYHLIDQNRMVVASIEQDYVPNGLIPGEYGDYVSLDIDCDGRITNWPKHPNLEAFFQGN